MIEELTAKELRELASCMDALADNLAYGYRLLDATVVIGDAQVYIGVGSRDTVPVVYVQPDRPAPDS